MKMIRINKITITLLILFLGGCLFFLQGRLFQNHKTNFFHATKGLKITTDDESGKIRLDEKNKKIVTSIGNDKITIDLQGYEIITGPGNDIVFAYHNLKKLDLGSGDDKAILYPVGQRKDTGIIKGGSGNDIIKIYIYSDFNRYQNYQAEFRKMDYFYKNLAKQQSNNSFKNEYMSSLFNLKLYGFEKFELYVDDIKL